MVKQDDNVWLKYDYHTLDMFPVIVVLLTYHNLYQSVYQLKDQIKYILLVISG